MSRRTTNGQVKNPNQTIEKSVNARSATAKFQPTVAFAICAVTEHTKDEPTPHHPNQRTPVKSAEAMTNDEKLREIAAGNVDLFSKSAQECIAEINSLKHEPQADATATLQAQVDQLSHKIGVMESIIRSDGEAEEFLKKEALKILPEIDVDGDRYYVPGVAGIGENLVAHILKLRTALEKCVVALESEPFHSWRVKEAINTGKPLLNKP